VGASQAGAAATGKTTPDPTAVQQAEAGGGTPSAPPRRLAELDETGGQAGQAGSPQSGL